MANRKSLKELILFEDVSGLSKYDQFSQNEEEVKEAAKSLQNLVGNFTKEVQAIINKAGPFMAEQLLSDMRDDLNARIKDGIVLPQTSQLATIMQDLDKEKAELDKRDLAGAAEKAVPEKKPAAAPAAEKPAKKPIKVP